MKILIVEDDEIKLDKLVNFLTNTFVFEELVVRRAWKAGLREIIDNNFSIIILDMSLPTFEIKSSEDGGIFNSFGGEEILFEMKRKRIDSKALIVTQFENFGEGQKSISLEQLNQRLKKNFPGIYIGTVFFSASDSGWEIRMIELLKSFVEVKI
ncbi:MAG: Response regulator [uncultured bacterium]|nr:MAG: Response regulator [uncultured bacterium]